MANYNYSEFSTEDYDLNEIGGPKPGQKAPDFVVTNSAGETRHILDFNGRFLVLELGSITCPLFQSRRKGMASLRDDFADVSHAVLYIREAHPGASIPAHITMEQKTQRARQLREADGEAREILIDGIDGAAHQGFGGYPNSLFIINKNGCVIYRSAWNNPRATRRALKRILAGKPVGAEAFFLPAKFPVALRTLRHAGKGATSDFFRGLPILIWKNLIRRNLLLAFGKTPKIAPGIDC